MTAISILTHSVRMLLNNLPAAFRVSIVLYLGIIVINYINQVRLIQLVEQSGGTIRMSDLQTPSFMLPTFALIFVSLLLGFWISIAWHRYILLQDLPDGIIPPVSGGAILAYLWLCLQIAVAIILVIVGALFAIGFILAIAGITISATFVSFVTTIIGLIFFYRLCPVLPAAAIGKKLTLSKAWSATRGQTGTIVTLALIGGFVVLVIKLPSMFGGDPLSIINLTYAAVTGWFTMLIGVSVMTTFYGHFVEGRKIV